MQERGVSVDHATINRWVLKYSPLLEHAFHRRNRPVQMSWRMDETYLKVKGQWRYLSRAVDKSGQTIDGRVQRMGGSFSTVPHEGGSAHGPPEWRG